MLTSEAVTIAGYDTRIVRGPGVDDKPPLLFLHGYSDSADGWRRIQRRLSQLGYRSIAVDQPSHGECAPLPEDGPVIPEFVRFAAEAAKLAGDGGPVVVVGNSLGGAHTLLLAQHHPGLVRAVVPISPAGFTHPDYFSVLGEDSRVGNALRTRLRGSLDDDEARGANRPTTDVRTKIIRRVITTNGMRVAAFGSPWRAPAGFIEDWRRQWRDPDRRAALRSLVPRVRDEYIQGDPFDLAAVTMPALVLWGTRDRLVKVESRAELEAGLPDCTFVELRNIGHMPQLEVPGRTTKLIHEFVRDL